MTEKTPLTIGNLDRQPRVNLSHLPTPLESAPNLSRSLGITELYIKRDDCTGLASGGNKARQLEFYLGQAMARNADTILITGAVQSNFTRSAAAAARKLGLDIHIQTEDRVPGTSAAYKTSGNLLISKLMGATLHPYPHGEDEAGADRQLEHIASNLSKQGRTPFVIHLGQGHPPYGALGYVAGGLELHRQLSEGTFQPDQIIVPSGSGATHAGMLFALRALGNKTPVTGICVRREASLQRSRIVSHCENLASLLEIENPVTSSDIITDDAVLAPGYGQINQAILVAIKLTAYHEGIILDPVYSGRTMAGLINLARQGTANNKILFVHTGGLPAIFAYENELSPIIAGNT